MNQKISSASNKITSMHIDLSGLLMINRDIASLADDVTKIKCDLSSVLLGLTTDDATQPRNKRMRVDSKIPKHSTVTKDDSSSVSDTSESDGTEHN